MDQSKSTSDEAYKTISPYSESEGWGGIVYSVYFNYLDQMLELKYEIYLPQL